MTPLERNHTLTANQKAKKQKPIRTLAENKLIKKSRKIIIKLLPVRVLISFYFFVKI